MTTKLWKPALLVAALGLNTATFAQKAESIIIKKKGDKKEKTTVVIDGDKITVNGKDISELNDEDIDVIVAPKIQGRAFVMPPNAPRIAPRGGWADSFKDLNFENFNFSGNKAFLGVVTAKDDKGAKVTEVTKESPAEKAGLKKDDIITKVGDNKIENADDLYAAIGELKADDKVEITYLRDGKEKKSTATLAENKNKTIRTFNWSGDDGLKGMFNGDVFTFGNKPKLGLQIQDEEDGTGVKVLEVDAETPAGKAGIQEGDVIVKINGENAADVSDVKDKLKNVKEGDAVKLDVKRNGKSKTLEIKIPKKLKKADL